MIKKIREGGRTRYKVMSDSGKHMGTYDSPEAAKARLRQVEFFKAVTAGKIKIPARKRGAALRRLSSKRNR